MQHASNKYQLFSGKRSVLPRRSTPGCGERKQHKRLGIASELRLRCFGPGAADIWQVHHCENHDVSFRGVVVHAASSCRRSLSSLPRKSRNARMRATSVACTAPVSVFPLFSRTCVDVLWHAHCPINMRRRNARRCSGGFMSLILGFTRKWVGWYRVLRYSKAFSFASSVRYGLWLARG